MGKNSKQRRQATVDELSWAREYMDLFVPCNNGYNVIISKKGNMLIRHVAGGDIVSIPKASITNRQAFDNISCAYTWCDDFTVPCVDRRLPVPGDLPGNRMCYGHRNG